MSATPDQTQHDTLLTADEVAELLAVSTAWVYEQSRRGRIPTVTLGRYRRYRFSSVQSWIAEQERRRERPSASRMEHDAEWRP